MARIDKQAELPFDLNLPIRGKVGRKLFSIVKGPLQRLLALEAMNDIYRRIPAGTRGAAFARRALQEMRIDYRISEQDLQRIPRTGPVVVVANHPFGGIEGVMLADLLQSVRPDVKIMANFMLQRIEEMRELFIFVDPFGSESSAKANLKGMREAIGWLKDGKMMGVFPAGEVAHLQLKRREIIDPAWSPTIARIIRRTEASVLPIYFDGGNGALFQMLGLVHPRLRTAMLPHELINKKGHRFTLRIGNAIGPRKIEEFESDESLMGYLRQRTYLLGCRDETAETRETKTYVSPAKDAAEYEPIAPQGAVDAMIEEVKRLGDQTVVDSSEYAVIEAEARQIPNLLQEIGRLREITFRATGEGTGKSLDLDKFDTHYIHLFAWNKVKNELVGAYRLGPTDTILKQFGPKGLYLTTLFDFKAELLEQFNPALELGRSFVRQEYQKNYAPLLMLWKGIGQFICRHPKYKVLVGPVSISNKYNTISRQLMVAFLQSHNSTPDLARFVKPRTPFAVKKLRGRHLEAAAYLNDIEEVSSLISEIEGDEKGVPILLKQYLKLGGKTLGFNLDPNFSDALDGLLYVDLTTTDRRVLEKYMGKEAARKFLEHHQTVAIS
jgi:putative hemolysin